MPGWSDRSTGGASMAARRPATSSTGLGRGWRALLCLGAMRETPDRPDMQPLGEWIVIGETKSGQDISDRIFKKGFEHEP
ncbi:hypothetical protein GSP01_26550 [Gluconobacter sphaericus NBRC 12467]|nr:hypothetical protein GSP01_26550 [Gluconobacter sphaericus NBRC 12467]